MKGRWLAGLIALWALLPLACAGVLVSESDGLTQAVSLVDGASILCSDRESLTIDEVSSSDRASSFGPAADSLIRGFTTETCWIRISIKRTEAAPKQWFIRVGKPYLDEVSLFVEQAQRNGAGRPDFQETRLGDWVAFRERPVPDRLFVFPLTLPDTEPATVYLRIRSSSTFRAETIDLFQQEGLRAAAQRELPLYSFVFGVIFLGLFSNLMFGIRLRDKMYAYYTVYLAALLVLNVANSGLLAQWILFDHPVIADRTVGAMMALTICSGLAFFNKAFGLGDLIPRGNIIVFTFIGLQFLFGIGAAAGYFEWAARPTHVFGLIGVLGILIACAWRLSRGEKGFGLYMLAFSAQLCASILGLGRNLSWMVIDLAVDQIILIATGVHVVLLNLAVARRLREMETRVLRLDADLARIEIEKASIEKEHQFMSMIAHEFRTPLAIIDMSAQRIAAAALGGDSKIASRCRNIRDAVNRQIGLMDEFLDNDRILARLRNIDIQPQRTDDFINSIKVNQSRVSVEIGRSGVPKLLLCDAPLLRIAVENLIKNAISYSPPNAEVSLRFSMTANAGLRVDVVDQGAGISEEDIPVIFDKYVRGRSAQSSPGMGLGLYLVSEIVRAHGGGVTVESRPGSGAHFSIVLPPGHPPAQAFT